MFIKFKANRASISGEKGRRVAMFWENGRMAEVKGSRVGHPSKTA
jgi:hypothetical protein